MSFFSTSLSYRGVVGEQFTVYSFFHIFNKAKVLDLFCVGGKSLNGTVLKKFLMDFTSLVCNLSYFLKFADN